MRTSLRRVGLSIFAADAQSVFSEFKPLTKAEKNIILNTVNSV